MSLILACEPVTEEECACFNETSQNLETQDNLQSACSAAVNFTAIVEDVRLNFSYSRDIAKCLTAINLNSQFAARYKALSPLQNCIAKYVVGPLSLHW